MKTNYCAIFISLLAILLGINSVNAATNIPLPVIPATQFLVTNYGAKTTNTDNASYINAAITAANTAGGGTVVLPAGTFLSGPITMKSNVNLYLAAGDTLRILPYGSGNGTVAGTYPNNGTTDQYNPFIYGKNLSNIEVSGSGVIDGQGSAWWTAYASNSNMKRPCLIRLVACNTAWITGITLMNSPGVHLTLGQSSTMGSNGTISYVTIKAPSTAPNTDAIDTWYWKGIYIHHCNLSEGDDNVAMDSYSQNVTIKNCTLGTGHGISVGSYATGVNTITVDSCTFNGTTNGIRLKASRDRGGSGANACYNLSYSNITMQNVTWPFYITSYYPTSSPSKTDTAQAITATTPTWRNVYFKNITVTGSTYAGFIWGLPEQLVKDVVFDNVQISATTRGMQIVHADSVIFKNCSSITLPSGKGNAIYSPYDTIRVRGINPTTGKSTSCTTSAIEEVKTNGSVTCYPNPAQDYVMISSDEAIAEIKLYSLTGTQIRDINAGNENQYSLDLASIPRGYYILNLLTANGTLSSHKLLKQ
jgi:Endopolygalacturonase